MSRWYRRDGTLFTELITQKNGGQREANVKDARELGLVPSVTTILDVLSKPGLDIWKQNILMQHVYTAAINKNLDDAKEYAYTQYNAERDKATGFGTLFHNTIEAYLKSNLSPTIELDETIIPFFVPFMGFMEKNQIKGVSEKRFVGEVDGMCYAGTVDLIDGDLMYDFKTQDTKKTGKFVTYKESLWQGAGYLLGDSTIKNFKNVYISSTEPNVFKIKEYKPEEIADAKEIFKTMLKLFYQMNKLGG